MDKLCPKVDGHSLPVTFLSRKYLRPGRFAKHIVVHILTLFIFIRRAPTPELGIATAESLCVSLYGVLLNIPRRRETSATMLTSLPVMSQAQTKDPRARTAREGRTASASRRRRRPSPQIQPGTLRARGRVKVPLYARVLSLTAVAMRAHNAAMQAYKCNSAATRVRTREDERRRDGAAAACAIARERKRETKHKTERSEHLYDKMYPSRFASLFFASDSLLGG